MSAVAQVAKPASDSSLQTIVRPLDQTPQMLGLLPSLWFWNQHENARRGTIVVAPALVFLQLACASLYQVLHPLTSGMIAGLGTYLLFGLLERYIRAVLRSGQEI